MEYFEENNSMLDDLGSICLEELMLSSDAYVCMINMNMCGYKKLHRRLSKKFHDLYLCLQNESMERYGKPLSTFKNFKVYKTESMQEHLKNWNSTLKEHYKRTGFIIKEIFDKEGYISENAQNLQRLLYKNIIKNDRIIHKLEDLNWSMESIYDNDAFLCKKIKYKEYKDKIYI